jgi:hypothetical protein
MDINETRPIIPGGGAANIILGLDVEVILYGAKVDFTSERVVVEGIGDLGTTRYRSAYVDFWTRHDAVFQVMVHDGYSGKVLGKVGLGSLLGDVEKLLGPLAVINENMVVKGLPGISFEPEIDKADSPITEIYVWQPDSAEIMDHGLSNEVIPLLNFNTSST